MPPRRGPSRRQAPAEPPAVDLYAAVKPTILVVDESTSNLELIASLLQGSYTVRLVRHGVKALEAAGDESPHLILLDVSMPDIDGYEVCRRLKADPFTREIPVIFLTDRSTDEDEEKGMDLGAVDYITRPIKPPILLSRVKAHCAVASTARTMRIDKEYLEVEVAQRAQEVLALRDTTVLALASLAETRDTDTGNHLRRTQHYVRALGNHFRTRGTRFANFLSADMVDTLFRCAPLHDIGKVGIPDRILLNPGRFKLEEFEIMKTHPRLGLDAIANAQASVNDESELFEVAKEIVYSHHEKWDGSGYPQGLRGDAIPIPARLMALADVYDALICRRVYKPGLAHELAVRIILEGRGKHFDPDVVDAFVALGEEFQAIATRFADTEEDLLHKASYRASAAGAGQISEG